MNTINQLNSFLQTYTGEHGLTLSASKTETFKDGCSNTNFYITAPYGIDLNDSRLKALYALAKTLSNKLTENGYKETRIQDESIDGLHPIILFNTGSSLMIQETDYTTIITLNQYLY